MRALFISADGFEDLELYVPYYRLLEERVEVHIAGPRSGSIVGARGYRLEVNLPFAEVDPGNYDLLVLPGGKGPERVRMHPKAIGDSQQILNSGKIVAAICHGPLVLASSGALKGRRATGWPGIMDDLRNAGAEVLDRDVVVDGNLVTSRRPDDLPAFNRELVAAMRRLGSPA